MQETALAFARIAASYLLPSLTGIKPPALDIEQSQRTIWREQWKEVAQLLDDPKGNPLAVRRPDAFEVSSFNDITAESLDETWAELKRRQNITTNQMQDKVLQKRQEEMERINHVPQTLTNNNNTQQQSPLTARITYLQLLEEEYQTVLRDIQDDLPVEEPERLEARESFLYAVPFIGSWLKQRRSQELCRQYNDILEERIEMKRNTLLRENLRELLRVVQTRLDEALRWFQFKDTNLNEQCEELLTYGTTSPAWQGKLNQPHPHQRHLFDLNSLQDPNSGSNLASESLFMRLTFPLLEPDGSDRSGDVQRFHDATVKKHIGQYSERCMHYLHTGRIDNSINGLDTSDIGSQNKERFADRVVDFFYLYYTDKLQKLNMFHLLRMISGQHRNVVSGSYQAASGYLLEHLLHIKGLVRDLIAFQETLWSEGPGRLDTSLFLSMNAEDGDQKRELSQVVSRLGALTDRNQTPQVEVTNDLHRLQLMYGQHGISLATIPDFYRDTNSFMAEYIRYQGDWYGNGPNSFLPHPGPQIYGSNKMPVHNSGEMERIVCDPLALNYQVTQSHADIYGTNLIGRVIRQSPGLDNTPDWTV